ncbi:MAG: hypothetical protein IPH43_00290 [Xanthomonadales bacterium]|nr:hypothetical protein [Xanthomonadales bacterium]
MDGLYAGNAGAVAGDAMDGLYAGNAGAVVGDAMDGLYAGNAGRLHGCRRYASKDGGGRALSGTRAESNAGAVAEQLQAMPPPSVVEIGHRGPQQSGSSN